jgi:hypothetical protein
MDPQRAAEIKAKLLSECDKPSVSAIKYLKNLII